LRAKQCHSACAQRRPVRRRRGRLYRGPEAEWPAGLARGLTLAGHAPLQPDAVYYPFYGNLLADLITAHERAGGHAPDLEAAQVAGKVAVKAARTRDDMILEAAGELGFRPSRRLARTDPELVAPIIAVERALEDDRMRAAVQKVVADAIGRAVADGHHDLVVIGHSLGSIVAYDLCSDFTASIRVRLLVTAGSPLGYPIVRRNLRGGAEGVDDRPVPAVLDPIPGTGRDRVWWLNAFDVLDVVALVHPLASRFSDGGQRIRDERTFNPTYPHSIADYLSDPDVAGPIGDVLARG
jgi:hypothetical protein